MLHLHVVTCIFTTLYRQCHCGSKNWGATFLGVVTQSYYAAKMTKITLFHSVVDVQVICGLGLQLYLWYNFFFFKKADKLLSRIHQTMKWHYFRHFQSISAVTEAIVTLHPEKNFLIICSHDDVGHVSIKCDANFRWLFEISQKGKCELEAFPSNCLESCKETETQLKGWRFNQY